jgi:type IV pilus assembly protein PilE
MSKSVKGFTLIELMIAVTVMAILVAIAVPTYNNYIIKSRRSDAKASLVTIAQLQETYFADNNKYADGMGIEAFSKLRAEREGFPLVNGSYYSKEGYYKLDFKKITPTYFQARATPVDNQKTGEQSIGQCFAFLIDSRGEKTIEFAPSENTQTCWD